MPADGNRWNNGVTHFPAFAHSVFVPIYICVCVRAGWRPAWQVGGSHLFPALQHLSSRTFLHLVPVTVPSGVCNLYFSSICTASCSFPSVSWTVQTLTDLWEMAIHVIDISIKVPSDVTSFGTMMLISEGPGPLILLAVNLKCFGMKKITTALMVTVLPVSPSTPLWVYSVQVVQ